MTLQTYIPQYPIPEYKTRLVDSLGIKKIVSKYITKESVEESVEAEIPHKDIEIFDELNDSHFLKSVAKAREEYTTGQVVSADEVMKMLKKRM